MRSNMKELLKYFIYVLVYVVGGVNLGNDHNFIWWVQVLSIGFFWGCIAFYVSKEVDEEKEKEKLTEKLMERIEEIEAFEYKVWEGEKEKHGCHGCPSVNWSSSSMPSCKMYQRYLSQGKPFWWCDRGKEK